MPGDHEQEQRAEAGQATQGPASELSPSDPTGAAAQGQSAELQDPAAEVVDVFASFELAAGTVLNSTFTRELRTDNATTVTARASRERLQIFTSAPVVIDALWPGQNMRFYGLTLDFASGELSVDIAAVGGLGQGFLDYTEEARTEIANLVRSGIAGTAMARAGYDPFGDDNLAGTLAAIQANFQSLGGAGGGGEVGGDDLQNVAGGATLRMVAPFQRFEGGNGVVVDGGSQFSIRAQGQGSVADLTAARDDQGRAEAVNLRSVQIADGEFRLVKDGETVAVVESLSIARGGQVQIGQFTLAGSAQTAAGAESLLRLLGAAVNLASRGVPGEAALHIAAHSPDIGAEIVPGLARAQIEGALTDAVRVLLRDNAYAIPGLDLSRVFGGG